jgi:hypothetical protein
LAAGGFTSANSPPAREFSRPAAILLAKARRSLFIKVIRLTHGLRAAINLAATG